MIAGVIDLTMPLYESSKLREFKGIEVHILKRDAHEIASRPLE